MSRFATERDVLPWYRQAWPWFLISLPATAVVTGSILLYLAITTWDGLVVDDYYREGRAIDQTIARSVRAADMGLAADLRFRTDEVSIRLGSGQGVTLPPTVRVTIAHPTRSGLDQTLLLRGKDGVFSGRTAPLSTGRWLVQIEDESRTWRLVGSVNLPAEGEVRILPYES